MSQATIARWQAIPLERPLKRSRSSSDDGNNDGNTADDDDNVSLVSRTPSPPPMDVDPYSYDAYVDRPAPETITVETPLKQSNLGFAMLSRMGWAPGQPLGLSGDGRVEPVPFQIKQDSLGVGRLTQDFRVIETTVSQRRDMVSERMARESDEQRQAREDQAARQSVLASELSTTIQAFYCELCSKQFKNVAAYTEHTNSYAHAHKARFKDMQSSLRGTQDDYEKRVEKERKREEKELRKLAAAKGIKLAKPSGKGVVLPASGTAMDIAGEPLPSTQPMASTQPRASTSQDTPPQRGSNSGWAPVDGVAPTGRWAPAGPPLHCPQTVPRPEDLAQANPPPAPPSTTVPPVEPTGKAHASRLGWQKFQSKRSNK